MKAEVISIESRIFNLRETHVMIDRDLAELYQVETKVLNQAVKRNIERFPAYFRFQLLQNELDELVTICDRLLVLKHSSTLPYAFTEQGVGISVSLLAKWMDYDWKLRRNCLHMMWNTNNCRII